jgi:multiple sugar transport system ATP-binding protein
LYLSVDDNEDPDDNVNLVSRVSSRSKARHGDRIRIAIDTTRVHIFDKETDKIIAH